MEEELLTLFPSSSPAKCTDGSPAGYYYEPGLQKTKWVVWIEGGGLCQSNADCANRAKSALGSSKYWKQSRIGSQHQSKDPAQNPDFYDWQHVYLSYCSGDVWVGQSPEPFNPWANLDQQDEDSDDRIFGGRIISADERRSHSGNATAGAQEFSFAGHTYLASVIDELKTKYGMVDATDVLLTGCSAGGIGTFANTDWLADQFDSSKTKVRGNPMAGYFGLPISTYAYWSQNKTDPDPTHSATSSWLNNTNPYRGAAVSKCMADSPGADEMVCGAVPRYYRFTSTPLFVSENTADSYQVYAQGGCPGLDIGYIDYLRDILAGSLRDQVINGPKNTTDGLFAPACLAHCLAWKGGKAPVVSGVQHQQAVGDWYYGRGNTNMRINDDPSSKALVSCTDI